MHERKCKSTNIEKRNKIPVPDHSSVRQFNVSHVFPQSIHLVNTLLHDWTSSEDCSMGLHGLLHLESDLRSVDTTISISQFVNVSNRGLTSVVRERSNGLTWLGVFSNGLSTGTTKDNLENIIDY